MIRRPHVAPAASHPTPVLVAAEPAVRVRGLRKRYGAHPVLAELDATFPAGRITGLVGPNGAGKTTLIKILLGLVTPDAGNVEVLGRPLDGTPAYRARLGYMPQAPRFAEQLTGRELVAMVRSLRGATGPVDESLLDWFTGTRVLDQRVATLSGGTRQKLNAALAFLFRPDLLILDEPTIGLDPQARHLIWDGLRQLLSQGKTILLTTHFMDEAERLATRLAVIDHGTLIACDTPRALLAAHVEPEVVEVYGDDARTWADNRGRALSRRLELAGETAFCYASDAAPLLADLATRSGLRYLHRPANLEDLFIKLTGRELRD